MRQDPATLAHRLILIGWAANVWYGLVGGGLEIQALNNVRIIARKFQRSEHLLK